MQVLNRFKLIKDLVLGKLDEVLARLSELKDLQKTVNQLIDKTEHLEQLAASQLANDASLLQASIQTIQILNALQSHPSVSHPSVSSGSLSPWLLLGTAQEVGSIQQQLKSRSIHSVTQDWHWGEMPDLAAFPDSVQVVVCKVPTDPAHWEALQKLQQQVPEPLLMMSGLRS
jgi:hypothetical protein